ncbi:MAG: nucleoside triphosphate pyrophosphohydrolase [Patescibacteria group bacterium]
MKEYNKLVRDKIPEIIAAKGEKAETHIADEAEFMAKTKEKLSEELAEFLESDNPEELADLLEITYATAAGLGVSEEKLNDIRQEKRNKRGGFTKKIILERS